jgi:glycerophosphoryl diester phosphodiesterase family protein
VATLSRRNAVVALTTLAASAALAPGALGATPDVTPLRRAHAHNDYEHGRPLFDALSHGFTSVEADIWLVDGELLVAHDEIDLDPSRTLQSCYLDPLLARVRANGGSVYRGSGSRLPFQLLIDIKNTGEATYRELSRQLRPYRSILSASFAGHVHPGAVTAVVSGERDARIPMEAERLRYAFYDGRLTDLAATPPAPASFIPLISDNWTRTFTWLGVGPFPEAERERLHEIVTTAHARDQRVRFWATPDIPGPDRDAVWRELLAADVDHINTDDLAGLATFLRAEDQG